MAARNSSRGTRLSGRSGGNRPRTHPTPNPRRKPATPKRSKLRTASDALRGAQRATRAGDRARRPDDATLKAARSAKLARTAGVDALRRGQALLRPAAGVLREVRRQLDLICSCVIVVHHALTVQNVLLDDDAALVLKRYVSDPLYEQVLLIERLLGDEDNEGGRS